MKSIKELIEKYKEENKRVKAELAEERKKDNPQIIFKDNRAYLMLPLHGLSMHSSVFKECWEHWMIDVEGEEDVT